MVVGWYKAVSVPTRAMSHLRLYRRHHDGPRIRSMGRTPYLGLDSK